jgi:SNF2 family DNA or RNA helicase
VVVDVYDVSRVVITSDNPMRDKDLIRSLPGSSYDLKAHRWTAPLTWATCRALRGIFDERLIIGEALASWAANELATRITPSIALREAYSADGDEDLYPFQRAGVQFLAYAKKALLCDEMGTGKTVQTIRTITELVRRGENPFPVLVVAPNNMTLTWKKEWEKWYPGVNAVVVKGSAAQRRAILEDTSPHVFIINYESVRTHSRLAPYGSIRLKRCTNCDATLADIPANKPSRCEHCPKELNEREWKTLIVDEAHRMKDPKAKQTRACWSLRTKTTEFIYALSGTAIANAPHDLWSALHLLSKEEWPSRSKYIDRYCLASWNVFGGMSVIGLREENKKEFFDIIDPRMRRMPKEAVLPQLPKKTYSERYVEMTAKQAKAYRQMEDGLIALLGDDSDAGIAVAVNPLVQLTRMTQFASAYAEVDDEGHVHLTAPSNKIDALMDLLEDMGNEPLVVFAQSRQLIDLAAHKLEAAKISFSMIVGGQTPDEREKAKDDFQNGHVRVVLCTIAAGGIGITLTRSSTACFLQRSWSMVDNSQAEDRVHRIGSEIHDKIEIVDIISVGTIEERQRITLASKSERLEEVMRDKDTLKRLLTGQGE